MEQTSYKPVDIERTRAIINRISIFHGLSEEQMSEVFKELKGLSYRTGDYVYKRGEEPSHIYIIATGEIKIVLETSRLSLELISLGVGDCFGEASIIGIQSHTANALTVKDAELIVMERRVLLSFFEKDKDLFGILLLNIARETSRRLHLADESLIQYLIKQR